MDGVSKLGQYAPFDKASANVTDRIAWALCQIIDDDAPMRWTRYRFAAGCIAKNPEVMADLRELEGPPHARPLEEWHEDMGSVTWWKFPVEEPSYIGSPLCDDWPGYHTHFTPHPPIPEAPR